MLDCPSYLYNLATTYSIIQPSSNAIGFPSDFDSEGESALQAPPQVLHQLKSTKQSPLQGRDLSTSRDALRGGLNQWGEVLPSAAGPSKLVINHRAVVHDRERP